jgi:SAM-dependent methyltransferase
MSKEWLRFVDNPVSYLRFVRDFINFRSQSSTEDRFSVNWLDCYPCLGERTETTGFDKHYLFHTAWAARLLAEIKPGCHTDISSSLYFVSIASAFVPMRFYEYRPTDLGLSNLECAPADLLSLPFGNDTIESLSCMHVVEHVGLGRYGDRLDPDGDLKAIAELKRVLATAGHLLFAVPIGSRPRVKFNAHRIYTYDQIIEYFSGLELKEFALVLDKREKSGLIRDASKELADKQIYGCGCFCFRKPGTRTIELCV